MIEILEKPKTGNGCLACYQEKPDYNHIYQISLSTNDRQSNSIRLCPNCLEELKEKIKEIK